MKKTIAVIFALCLLLVPIVAVQAQTTAEVSLAFPEDPVYVSADDFIVLRIGWLACTPGFVRQYQSAAHYELELDGQPLITPGKNNQYYTSIEPFDGTFSYECLIPPHERQRSITDWRYPLGTLTPGTYEIYFRLWFDHRVNDGYDLDGDGKLDVYEGTLQERTKTLIVE